jgi:hypothetical protein
MQPHIFSHPVKFPLGPFSGPDENDTLCAPKFEATYHTLDAKLVVLNTTNKQRNKCKLLLSALLTLLNY